MVYPNPVQGNKLYINTGDLNETSVVVEMFSLAGNLVASTVQPINRGVLEIDITNLAKGMYLLRMTTSNDSFNYKIIRQ